MAQRKQAPTRAELEPVAIDIIMNEEMFNLGEVEIRGNKELAFINAPPDLRFLLVAAQEFADRTAVVFDDQRWTYGELIGKAIAVANGLIERHDIKPGTRIALAMRNSPEWIASYFGILAAGGVVVPINGWWTSEEMGYGLSDSGAKYVIAGFRQADRIKPHKDKLGLTIIGGRSDVGDVDDTLDQLMAAGAGKPPPAIEIDTDSDFAIFYTSGSTGAPKGAVLTHRGAVSTLLSYGLVGAAMKVVNRGEDFFGENPAVLVGVPLFHCTGSHAVMMMSFLSGRKMVMMRKWDPADAVELIQKEKITNVVGVPTMSHEITLEAERQGIELESLMDMSVGGAKRPPAHVEKLNETFPHAWSSTGYGLTETNAIGAYISTHDYQARPGSCGRAVPPVIQIKTADENGDPTPAGEPGEVWIKGPILFRGYLNQPEATAAVMTEDGWFKTGDVGIMDEEGFLFIVDRIKDMLLRGGENISCLEVEHALVTHPDILEAAVIGIPDERLGERVGAVLFTRPGSKLSDDEINEYLEPHLAKYKRPDTYWYRTEPLPRGGTGKVDKPTIRKLYLEEGVDA